MTHDSSPAAVAAHLVQTLGEQEEMARRKLWRIVREIGTQAALDLLVEALRIEADGGMLINDGSRRRTPGGVYMKLVKERVSPEVRKKLFPYPRKAASKPVPAAVAQETPEPSASVLPALEPLKPATQPTPKAAPKQTATPEARPCAACGEPAAVVGKFHFTRAGKQCICAPCADLGFVFGPSGDVVRLQGQVA